MKITIESKDKEVEFNPTDLFNYPESPIKELQKPKKTHIKWRDSRPGCSTFTNDQIISDANPDTWTITYHMAKSPLSQHVFRVPSENRPFIEEAILTGCLKRDVIYDITIESDQQKRCQWIEIQEL